MAKNWLILKIAAIISLAILLLLAGSGVYMLIITKGNVAEGLDLILAGVFLLIISSIFFQIINLNMLYYHLPRVEDPSKKLRRWHRILFFVNCITIVLLYFALAVNIDSTIKIYARHPGIFSGTYRLKNTIFLTLILIGNSFNFYTIPLAPRLLKYLRQQVIFNGEHMLNNLGTTPPED